MRRVVIESPYAGNRSLHEAYAREAMKDCLSRGEAPFASHLLYTQVLDDDTPEDRKLGMDAGFTWGLAADAVVVYMDLGLTAGMAAGIARATCKGLLVEYRYLRNPVPVNLDQILEACYRTLMKVDEDEVSQPTLGLPPMSE